MRVQNFVLCLSNCGFYLRRFVKFQGVSKLSIFIEDNQGEEETTRVQKIVLYGTSGETMNVKDIKKIGEENKEGS